MNCNFYLDRPYNPEIDNEIIKRERKKAKKRKRRLANRYLNPNSTSVYVFFSPGKVGRIKYRTSIKIKPKHWDFENGKVRSTAVGSLELNLELEKLASRIIKETYSAESGNESLTRNEYKKIVTYVVDEKVYNKDFKQLTEIIQEFKDDKSKYVKKGTLKEYRTVFWALSDFQKREKENLSLMDFDKQFHIRFEDFLSKKKNPTTGEIGLRNDTIYKYIYTLRVFLRWCSENGYKVPDYTFKRHKSAYKKKARNEIVVLTEDELEKLATYDLSNHKSYERVRDLFLFMAYTGQRFSDVKRFSKADVYEDRWDFISQKTGKRVVVPFNGYIKNALIILKKYDFELPTISNQKFNEYIKEIGALAEINDTVRIMRYKGKKEIIEEKPKHRFMTSHMGRRTAVTILLSKGVPITLVQKLTQHSKISTLMKYESAGTDSLIDALNKY